MPDYKQLMEKKSPAKKTDQITAIPSPKRALKKIVFLLVLAVLIVIASFWARSSLLHSSAFKISKVSIVDADGIPLRNPKEIFCLETDTNLFSFDMKSVARDIQARHPKFAAVHIRKQFPNTVLIIVKRREPVAIVGGRKSFLIDEEGFIIPFESEYENLPEIIGVHPKQIQLYIKSNSLRLKLALGLLKELKKAKIYSKYKVSQIDLRRYSDLVFYFENGIEVKMGQRDFERKISLLSGILTQLKVADTVPKYIDMRFGNPVVLP